VFARRIGLQLRHDVFFPEHRRTTENLQTGSAFKFSVVAVVDDDSVSDNEFFTLFEIDGQSHGIVPVYSFAEFSVYPSRIHLGRRKMGSSPPMVAPDDRPDREGNNYNCDG
jgi:hypothetical protein